jgi:low affinity Fe/Cu permease
MSYKHRIHQVRADGGRFARFSKVIAYATGRPWAFAFAALVILLWVVSGPFFHYSDTWQLVINTSTTIITFLMVFLIQNTQNRDSQAMHLKMDELIRAVKGAHTAMIDIEELTDHELLLIKKRYCVLAEHGRDQLRKGLQDTGSPAVEEQLWHPSNRQ